jgi:CheY-like chemotaxis protein
MVSPTRETRILIVDDSALMRQSLQKLLEAQEHWKVSDEAADGQEAIAKADEGEFDVIVLDFQMPSMDGLQVVKQLMSRSLGTPIPDSLRTAATLERGAESGNSRRLRENRDSVRGRGSCRHSPKQAVFPKVSPLVREDMRGDDEQQNHMFSYLSPEAQVRKGHPLRNGMRPWHDGEAGRHATADGGRR